MQRTLLGLVMVVAAARAVPLDEDGGESSRLTLGLVHTLVVASTPRPDFLPEETCNRVGGICLHVDECPAGKLAAKPGLCPKQKMKGAECCHGISILKKQCGQRSGVCRPSAQCARDLRDEAATDCPPGESCCALVSL